jgi:uncharacterized protein
MKSGATPVAKHADDEMKAAVEALADAELLVKENRTASAISRAYYAIFHAARAVLNLRGVAPKTHKGVKSDFSLLIVKPGLVEKEYGTILQDARDQRQTADYEVSEREWLSLDEGLVEMVANARRFVGRMQRLMNEE